MYNRDSYFFNIFGQIVTNHSIRDYEDSLLREEYINLNKNTNVKYKYKQKTIPSFRVN